MNSSILVFEMHCFEFSSLTGDTYAAFEPAFLLSMLFLFSLIAIRSGSRRWFYQGKEEDEEREQLRSERIEEVMRQADEILQERMTYYRQLSAQGKQKFLARLRVILATKNFYGKQGLKLSPEVYALTAGAIVQVTFGLRSFRMDRFSKIIIYPDVFYNKLLDRNLKGSTSPLGVLRFSWKHLVHGFEVVDDNLNLGLHEIAHALKVIIDEENDYLDRHLDQELAELSESGDELRNAILEGKLKVIRKYASTNAHEFFACCVEYFFESPEHFKSNLPRLYQRMCALLLQDPSNGTEDYHFVPAESTPERRQRKWRMDAAATDDDGFVWVQWMLLIGMFFGLLLLVVMHWSLESSVSAIVLFHLSLLTSGYFLFRRKLLFSGYTTSGLFALFVMFGWAANIGTLGLIVNRFIPLYSYEIVEKVEQLGSYGGSYKAIVPGSELRTLRRGVTISAKMVNAQLSKEHNVYVVAHLHYGLLGLKVVSTYEVFSVPKESLMQ
ncbi:MAG: zinc-dependent peptidase [Cryomorphaceae bacterium]